MAVQILRHTAMNCSTTKLTAAMVSSHTRTLDGTSNRQLVQLAGGCVRALTEKEDWSSRPPPIVAPGADPNSDLFSLTEELIGQAGGGGGGGFGGEEREMISKRGSVLDLLLTTLDPDALCLAHYLLGVDGVVSSRAHPVSDESTYCSAHRPPVVLNTV